jgi:type IX secretion system PorP/SprF family membrane protein
MTKRILFFYTVFHFYASFCSAQQLPFFAQYTEYHGMINPASIHYTFLTENGHRISGGATYRTSWENWNGLAPTTQVLRVESIKNKIVWGAYLQNDKVGITENTGGYGRIAYIQPLGKNLSDGGLAIGLNVGLNSLKLTTNNLLISNIPDPNIPLDPSVFSLDLGFGVFGYKKWRRVNDYVYGGLSIPQLWGNSKFRNEKHYYALLGFYMALNNQSYLEISSWIRKVSDVPFQYSLNVRYQPLHWCWVGSGSFFNKGIAFTPEFGFNIETGKTLYKIGYAYTMSNNLVGPSHEINLGFSLKRKQK